MNKNEYVYFYDDVGNFCVSRPTDRDEPVVGSWSEHYQGFYGPVVVLDYDKVELINDPGIRHVKDPLHPTNIKKANKKAKKHV